jgi:DNA processing protein
MQSWIELNMTPNIGPRMAKALLERFGSPDGVFAASRLELEAMRLSAITIESILNREFAERALAELEKIKAIGGDIILLDDGNYPALLREIPDPPIVLYVAGDWENVLSAPCVAVIGSRNCSTYGKNAAEMLSRDLAERGLTIVSGFARGIDTAAHIGAIKAKGKTAAILGTGLDQAYPKENAKLREEILSNNGAIITQFPFGTPPLGENFPYRNRVISGLSYAVLVIEASEKSGSLITARLAAEQNREILAVPGNITSQKSFGTNYLIKSGAKLLQHWQDVVAELPSEIAKKILPPPLDNEKKRKQAELVPAGLSKNELTIWQALSTDDATHIDDLIEGSGLNFGEVNSALVSLEVKELLHVLPGKRYARRIV